MNKQNKHLAQILIIEDEAVIRTSLRRLLERTGYDVTETGSVSEAEQHTLHNFDLIITDLRLPGEPGTAVIAKATDTPVLVMTSYASVRSAVESMQMGAVDYIAKPFDHDEMLLIVDRILKQSALERQNAALKHDLQRAYPANGLIGSCPAMLEVFDRIHKVAPTDTTVLILGESGTGKELVARAVHEQSARANAAIIAVNCAAIPTNLIESELFGHEKGAFTGAISTHYGLVEAADGGTLFLDEIGELPLEAQARLLRVIQENEIRRVGSTQSRKVNVRLIAATHRDLLQGVDAGTFRSDLYYRLHVMEICLPPLRERGDDINQLTEVLLEKVRQRLNRPPTSITVDAMEQLRQHNWPGNVRELENAIERAIILADGQDVTPQTLGISKSFIDTQQTINTADGAHTLDEYFCNFVRENEGQMNETELARHLGISRKTLWERRQKFGLPKIKS
ncbi:MAG: sigma-54 dependent transcriptional regulator [Thiohalomonadaceae bacterium]